MLCARTSLLPMSPSRRPRHSRLWDREFENGLVLGGVVGAGLTSLLAPWLGANVKLKDEADEFATFTPSDAENVKLKVPA